MNINEKLHANVKAQAKLNGVNLGDVEKAAGVSAGYLGRKNSIISVELLIRLAEILDVTVSRLLEEDITHEVEINEAISVFREAAKNLSKYYRDEAIQLLLANTLGGVEDDELRE